MNGISRDTFNRFHKLLEGVLLAKSPTNQLLRRFRLGEFLLPANAPDVSEQKVFKERYSRVPIVVEQEVVVKTNVGSNVRSWFESQICAVLLLKKYPRTVLNRPNLYCNLLYIEKGTLKQVGQEWLKLQWYGNPLIKYNPNALRG